MSMSNGNFKCCQVTGGSIQSNTPYANAVRLYRGTNPVKYAGNTSLSGNPDDGLGCFYCTKPEGFANVDWNKQALTISSKDDNHPFFQIDNLVLIAVLIFLIISRILYQNSDISESLINLAIVVAVILLTYKIFIRQ